MNLYEISSTSLVSGCTFKDFVKAYDEKKARNKYIKSLPDGANKIDSVKLVETDVIATEDEEREALAAIKEMVDELGPDSYIGTALEGCIEIAERNIQNGETESLKAHLDASKCECERLRRQLEEAYADKKPAMISTTFLENLAIFSTTFSPLICRTIVSKAELIARDLTLVYLLDMYVTCKKEEQAKSIEAVRNIVRYGGNTALYDILTCSESDKYHDVLEELLRHFWKEDEKCE